MSSSLPGVSAHRHFRRTRYKQQLQVWGHLSEVRTGGLHEFLHTFSRHTNWIGVITRRYKSSEHLCRDVWRIDRSKTSNNIDLSPLCLPKLPQMKQWHQSNSCFSLSCVQIKRSFSEEPDERFDWIIAASWPLKLRMRGTWDVLWGSRPEPLTH